MRILVIGGTGHIGSYLVPRHRVWACELAGLFGDEAAKTQLMPLCHDSNGHVRKAAQRVLGATECST